MEILSCLTWGHFFVQKLFMSSSNPLESGWCIEGALQAQGLFKHLLRRRESFPCGTSSTRILLCVRVGFREGEIYGLCFRLIVLPCNSLHVPVLKERRGSASDHNLKENHSWQKREEVKVKTETHFVLISSEQNINRLEIYLPKKYCWAPHIFLHYHRPKKLNIWCEENVTDCRFSRTFCYQLQKVTVSETMWPNVMCLNKSAADVQV